MDQRCLHVPSIAVLMSALLIVSSAPAQAPGPPAQANAPSSGAALPPLSSAPPAAPYTAPPYGPAPGYGAPPPAAGYPTPWPVNPAPPGQTAPADAPRATPLPVEMRYIEGRPIPPGYHPETRVKKGLVITGSILFGVPYIFSMSSAASSTFEPDRWLYLPVLGPFIDLAKRGDRCSRSVPFQSSPGVTFTNETCTDDSAARWFVMFDGLMQTTGATMLILGLALPNHLLVRDDAPYASSGTTVAWTLRPQRLGRAGYGLGVDGSF